MRKQILSTAGVLALFVASLGTPMAAENHGLPEGRYVTQKMIDAHDGMPFAVPRVGKFTVRKVEFPRDPAVECHVSMESLGRIIEYGVANGTMELSLFGKKKVRLKAHPASGGTYLCSGRGRDCVATVNVDSLVQPTELE